MKTASISTDVYLREERQNIRVIISSNNKPELQDFIFKRWQDIINTAARIIKIPACLIMKITPESMEVLASSETDGNPYKPAAYDVLGHGLYCETVIGRNAMLLVKDSFESAAWHDNPDVKLGMISYLGFPINWPDGESFGTICVLDNKRNEFDPDQIKLMESFKSLIETDLERELRERDMQEATDLNDLKMREIHHRIKNQLSILSSLVQFKAMSSGEEVKDALKDINAKLRSAAVLHARIYQSIGLNTSLKDYIEDVIRGTLDSFGIDMDIEITGDAEINAKYYLDFGLLFCELVTNTVKYGRRGEGAKISVQFMSDPLTGSYPPGIPECLTVIYQDNGPGFPGTDVQTQEKKGLGSVIIDAVLKNMSGNVRRYNNGGAVTEFNVHLPPSMG